MNAVIYARFSSHNQTEQSIEGQLKTCYEFAQKNGYTIVGEYIDRAISGTTDARPDFLRMIEDSAKKGFQYVLVYQLDRFARNRYDSATYKAKLKKNGVRVLSARENITDDASGILVEGLLESMAEYYSAELAQKIRRGMAINAEKCLANGSNPGLGFKVAPDKHYIIDEETAPIVVRIFEEYAAGKTVTEICESLNNQGVRTSRGAMFNKNSLRKMLQNKRYIGYYLYKDIETPGGMPRIISDELFYKVQEIMSKNKKAPAHTKAKQEYLLTTKLFCGKCRDMMTGVKGTSHTGAAYYYYKCNNAKKKQCDKKAVQKDYIEDLVIAECRKQLTPANIDKIAHEVVALCEREKDNSNLKRIEKLMRENERKQRNLMSAVSECEIDSVRKSLYVEIARLNTELDTLKNEYAIEQAGAVSLTITEVKFFLTQLRKGRADDISYRKTLINVFVNAIYLYDDKLVIFFNSGDKPVTIDDELLDQIENSAGFVFGALGSTKTEKTSNPLRLLVFLCLSMLCGALRGISLPVNIETASYLCYKNSQNSESGEPCKLVRLLPFHDNSKKSCSPPQFPFSHLCAKMRKELKRRRLRVIICKTYRSSKMFTCVKSQKARKAKLIKAIFYLTSDKRIATRSSKGVTVIENRRSYCGNGNYRSRRDREFELHFI